MPYRYLPIENYGGIGNMRTAVLVGMDGSIDDNMMYVTEDGFPCAAPAA